MSKLATLFGLGYIGGAPGTLGSLVAVMIAYPLLQLPSGWMLLAVAIPAITWLGIIASNRYMHMLATDHDPKQIIIDEVAGQWLTFTVWHLWLIGMAVSGEAAAEVLNDFAGDIGWLAAGFLLFRMFDIAKPWPISWADKRVKGGLGVMLDDLLAAVFAGSFLYLLYFLWPLLGGQMESMA